MWVLWDVGPLVEKLVGNVGFIILYVVSGLSGILASVAWNPIVVSAGASGAVFGVFGTLLGFLARRRDSIPGQELSRLRNSALTFLGYNLLYGAMQTRVDMAAHVGGLAAGFACRLVLSERIEPAAGKRRSLRNARVADGGTVLVCFAAVALQGYIADVSGTLTRFSAAEAIVLKTVNSTFDRVGPATRAWRQKPGQSRRRRTGSCRKSTRRPRSD